MLKRIVALVIVHAIILSFLGCNSNKAQLSSNDVEIIVEEEIIVEGGEIVSDENNVNSNIIQDNQSVETPVSSEQPSTPSSQINSTESTKKEDDTINIDYEWKSHSQDYKLIAFTFDDGPKDLMGGYVNYFAEFEGAGTFFVNGRNINGEYEYNKMQNAINYGWDIGNHGDNHLVATIGGAGGSEATYDLLRADICNLSQKLESNLKTRDGAAYRILFYRPPNIKPTANTFKICAEENLAAIWLSHDALDWGNNSKEDSYNVFKQGIGKWKDGDIILCHETSQNTYEIIQEVLPDYFRAGYRFCSISELMELRGITIDQISGELKNYDNNQGMVKNIIDAAKGGK
ncbi:MAG: polysaccharide deacetylase family protein [Ruminococcaceae bacterium]|nr:polysaccharide deacetylase family protein [Oscillospiraceae bacterium]